VKGEFDALVYLVREQQQQLAALVTPKQPLGNGAAAIIASAMAAGEVEEKVKMGRPPKPIMELSSSAWRARVAKVREAAGNTEESLVEFTVRWAGDHFDQFAAEWTKLHSKVIEQRAVKLTATEPAADAAVAKNLAMKSELGLSDRQYGTEGGGRREGWRRNACCTIRPPSTHTHKGILKRYVPDMVSLERVKSFAKGLTPDVTLTCKRVEEEDRSLTVTSLVDHLRLDLQQCVELRKRSKIRIKIGCDGATDTTDTVASTRSFLTVCYAHLEEEAPVPQPHSNIIAVGGDAAAQITLASVLVSEAQEKAAKVVNESDAALFDRLVPNTGTWTSNQDRCYYDRWPGKRRELLNKHRNKVQKKAEKEQAMAEEAANTVIAHAAAHAKQQDNALAAIRTSSRANSVHHTRVLALFQAKEDWENVKVAWEERLLGELKELMSSGLKVDGKEYGFEVFFVGDYKALRCMSGMAQASARYFCVWCDSQGNERTKENKAGVDACRPRSWQSLLADGARAEKMSAADRTAHLKDTLHGVQRQSLWADLPNMSMDMIVPDILHMLMRMVAKFDDVRDSIMADEQQKWDKKEDKCSWIDWPSKLSQQTNKEGELTKDAVAYNKRQAQHKQRMAGLNVCPKITGLIGRECGIILDCTCPPSYPISAAHPP